MLVYRFLPVNNIADQSSVKGDNKNVLEEKACSHTSQLVQLRDYKSKYKAPVDRRPTKCLFAEQKIFYFICLLQNS